jgi:hypothetical protein
MSRNDGASLELIELRKQKAEEKRKRRGKKLTLLTKKAFYFWRELKKP